jgi:signal transduction histidine kinase
MKPLKTELQDAETLRELGSASVQIVHDLKNQLNGLKLYATFLRKRMEKSERPQDELETIGKLISGLERAANDTSLLVRYGRPLELRTQPRTDLSKLLAESAAPRTVEAGPGRFEGEFDPALLSEALKSISTGGADPLASAQGAPSDGAQPARLRLEEEGRAALPRFN